LSKAAGGLGNKQGTTTTTTPPKNRKSPDSN
jgi:hypothetical protein